MLPPHCGIIFSKYLPLQGNTQKYLTAVEHFASSYIVLLRDALGE